MKITEYLMAPRVSNLVSNPRWWKELRPLILPCCLAATAAVLPAVAGAGDWTATLALFTFFCVVGLLSALPYGTEFQQRTLPLLLSQPMERGRLWLEKLQVLAIAAIILAIVIYQIQRIIEPSPLNLVFGLMNWRIQKIATWPSALHFTLGVNFLFAAFCSIGFWSLRFRSNAAGILIGIATQLCGFLVLDFMIDRIYGIWIGPAGMEQLGTFFAAGLLYSATWVWLGWQYWRRQLPALVLGVLTYVLVGSLAQSSLTHTAETGLSAQQTLLVATFMLATLCSGCFWTLVARSAIGGAAFNLVIQFLLLTALVAAVNRIHGMELSFEDPRLLGPVEVIGFLYAALMLWFGKRKFDRLELREAGPEAGLLVARPSLLNHGWWQDWLRCRPEGLWANLLRKEVRLQRPLFTVAMLFVLCWVATLAVFLPMGESRDICGRLLTLLLAAYTPLTIVLAGCISLAEEKAGGLIDWHLTLPLSARNQWCLKLGVSVAACMLFGFALPWLLILLTPEKAHAELTRVLTNPSGGQMPLVFALIPAGAAIFSFSFWGVTLFGNTIRAVLVTALVVIAMYGSFPFVVRFGTYFGGLETDLLSFLFQVWGVSSDAVHGVDWRWLLLWAATIMVSSTALIQSSIQFRQVIVPRRVVFKYAAILAGVALLSEFWCADIAVSLDNLLTKTFAAADLHMLNNILPKL